MVFNLMTIEPCDHIIPIYNEICSYQQARITLIKLILDEILFVSKDIINVLYNFLNIFESRGLIHILCDSVSVITKQLHADVVSLNEIGTFPDETYGDNSL